MGTNIAALALGHGVPVTLIDNSDDVIALAAGIVKRKLRHGQLMGAFPGCDLAELTLGTSVEDMAGAAAVVEAVTELAEFKAKVIAAVSAVIATGTLLITNTSCIPVDEIGEWALRPDELVGVHFMNPAYLIKMVEVIRGTRTSEATMRSVGELLTRLGRTSLTVRDSPGFVINRLLHPLINAAAMVVQEGVADASVVDGLLEGCLGHATGPLRTGDLIGLDNLADSLRVLYERTGEESCRPCDLLLTKVSAGELGRKSGRGFFDYGKAL